MKKISILIALLLCLVGCSAKTAATTEMSTEGGYVMNETPMFFDYDAVTDMTITEEATPGAKVIKTVFMSIETKEFDTDLAALEGLLKQCGGWIEEESIYNNDHYYYTGSKREMVTSKSGQIVVRIPTENLDAFLSGTTSIGNITNRTINQKDVSENYFDTKGRLESYEAEKERLLALYDKAETLTEILEIESKITEINYQIDYYSGVLRGYDSKIDYSTVTINLDEVVDYTVSEKNYFEKLTQSFTDGITGFGYFVQDVTFFIASNIITLVIIAGVIVVCKKKGVRLPHFKKKNEEEK